MVTHWRTKTIVQFYGINSNFYLVDEHNYILKLKSGRELQFWPTPYLHFPGSIVTFDPKTKTLFSSDLFGAFSHEWTLFADDNYIEKMKTFHEHYMPSNDILRPVMEMLLLLDIKTIAPQHGSIINKNLDTYIKVLRDLECGLFLKTVKKNLKDAGGVAGICSLVLIRYASIYGRDSIIEALEGLDLTLEEASLNIIDYKIFGDELWDKLFENIFLKKGISWLVVIEPLVRKLSNEYGLPTPKIFASELRNAQQEMLLLKNEVIELREINEKINKDLELTQGKIIRCPLTGLYNESFFKAYLETALDNNQKALNQYETSLVVIGIDNMSMYRYTYGAAESDNIIKNTAHLLEDMKTENEQLFRLQGDNFALFMPGISKAESAARSEKIRNILRTADVFIGEVTVSIGVSGLSDFNEIFEDKVSKLVSELAWLRMRLAKSKGGNYVCSESSAIFKQTKGKILIVENDMANQAIIKKSLNNLKFQVVTASDGLEAFTLAEKESPDLIISEIMLPKIDGFVLCEKLSQQSSTKKIPFIIVSNLKNEDSVRRALSLGIQHYFKKPYLLLELLGVIQMKFKDKEMDSY